MKFIKKILTLLADNIKEVKTTSLGVISILVTLGVITSNIPAIQENTVEILTAVSMIAGVVLSIIAKDSKK